eukprot:jgi/Ulvmu1/10586/UM065_0040.1
MPKTGRELSSLGHNELTETRTRKVSKFTQHEGSTRHASELDTSGEPQDSDDTHSRDTGSSFVDTEPAIRERNVAPVAPTRNDVRNDPSYQSAQRRLPEPQVPTIRSAVVPGPDELGQGSTPPQQVIEEAATLRPPSAKRSLPDLSRTPTGHVVRCKRILSAQQDVVLGSNPQIASDRFRHKSTFSASPQLAARANAWVPDTMQHKHVPPPLDRRAMTPTCYGTDVPNHRGRGSIEPCPTPSKVLDRSLDRRGMVKRAALWAESGSLWLPYRRAHVQVVMEAVVDVLIHPHPNQLVMHQDVPVMIISSSGQTAADAKASFRYSCVQVSGRWQFHQEQLTGGAYQHIVPIVKLQTCREGVPGADALILRDIDQRIATPSWNQEAPEACDMHADININAREVEKPSHRTPATAATRRSQSILASPVKRHRVEVNRTPSQPTLPRFVEGPACKNVDRGRSAIGTSSAENGQEAPATALLDAHIKQYPNLYRVLRGPLGQHIIDMWHGSVAMQEYGAPALFVLASAITGYPVEFYRSNRHLQQHMSTHQTGWLWNAE